MTITTARKRFWADWNEFKSNPKKREIKKYISRMKSELGYNEVVQNDVEMKMMMEITKLHT